MTPPPSTPHTPAYSGTSTYSMSSGLASMLGERRHRQPPPNPPRFHNLVNETLSVTTNSQTQAVYSRAAATGGGMFVPALSGINTGTAPMRYRPENAMLSLVNRIRDIGLNSILSIVSSSNLEPVKQDPVDVGLNTVMFMKRKPVGGKARQSSISPTRILHRDPISSQSVGSGLLSARVKPKNTSTCMTTLATATTTQTASCGGRKQHRGLDQLSCVQTKAVITPPREALPFATLPTYMSPVHGYAALSPAPAAPVCQALQYRHSLIGGSLQYTNTYIGGATSTLTYGGGATSTLTSGTQSTMAGLSSQSGGIMSVPSLADLRKSPSPARRPAVLEGLKSLLDGSEVAPPFSSTPTMMVVAKTTGEL